MEVLLFDRCEADWIKIHFFNNGSRSGSG